MNKLTVLASLAALLLALLSACASSPSDSDCRGGKCDGFDLPDDQVPDTPCDGLVLDKSGRGLGTGKIAGRLNDPLANLALKTGDDCPTNFTDIIQKILAAPAQDGTSCDTNFGRRTMLVTETAQILGMPTNYRTVTAIDCTQEDDVQFGNPPGLMFSQFGLTVDGNLPPNVEIMAFDASQGIFNYYETAAGGRLEFFGNSRDFLQGRGSGDDRRCAGCHTGGGPVMKELVAPWLHWEDDTVTPGAAELVERHAALFGRKSGGIDMENITRVGNDRWNVTRLAHLRALGDTKEVLRPLFCNVEVNLANASSRPQSGEAGEVTFAPLAGPVHSQLLGFGSLNFAADEYDALIRANGQRIPSLAANLIETHFGLAFITPSDADDNYVQKLVEAGIVDPKLVNDVLVVDFTRAVFSEDRCGLLEFVPQIPAAELSTQSVRDGLISSLQAASPAAGTPARELLNNLLNPAFDMRQRVSSFEQACQARMNDRVEVSFVRDGVQQTREVPAALADYMRIISLNRNLARALEVFEFPATMPQDNLNVAPGTRLHPVTCEITNQFVAVAQDIDPENSCIGRCNQNQSGANCQCDDGCEQRGDCCSDFADLCLVPACSHSVCTEGSALVNGCEDAAFSNGTCVSQICAADPFCCEQSWDSACVNQATSVCGLDCTGIDNNGGGGTGGTGGGPPPPGSSCCKICTNSQPCGDSCISNGLTCNQPPGCACDASGAHG